MKTLTRKIATLMIPTGQFPPEKLPPKKIPTQDKPHLDNSHPEKLPSGVPSTYLINICKFVESLFVSNRNINTILLLYDEISSIFQSPDMLIFTIYDYIMLTALKLKQEKEGSQKYVDCKQPSQQFLRGSGCCSLPQFLR